MCIRDRARPDPADGLDRPGYGEADREYLLEVEGLGSEPAKLTVEIPAMQYAGSQIGEIMRQAGDALRNLMLGENPSADEVRTDLILPATVKGTGIQVEWSVEYTDCLDALGHVNNGLSSPSAGSGRAAAAKLQAYARDKTRDNTTAAMDLSLIHIYCPSGA